jgi:hypothetical protein
VVGGLQAGDALVVCHCDSPDLPDNTSGAWLTTAAVYTPRPESRMRAKSRSRQQSSVEGAVVAPAWPTAALDHHARRRFSVGALSCPADKKGIFGTSIFGGFQNRPFLHGESSGKAGVELPKHTFSPMVGGACRAWALALVAGAQVRVAPPREAACVRLQSQVAATCHACQVAATCHACGRMMACVRACVRACVLSLQVAHAFVGAPGPVQCCGHAAREAVAQAAPRAAGRRALPLRTGRSVAARMAASGGEEVVSPFAADEVETKVGRKEIPFTVEGVDTVLDSVRPYLIAGKALRPRARPAVQ